MIRLALFLAIIAFPVSAATVTVKAAEHDDFTRVVFYVPQNQTYTVDYIKDGVRLTFETRLNLKSDTLFTRLYADRIASVGLDSSHKVVTLDTNCTCDVMAFREGKELAVFDIRPIQSIVDEKFAVPEPDEQEVVSKPPPIGKLPLFLPELRLPTPADDMGATKSNLVKALSQAANRKLLNVDLGGRIQVSPTSDAIEADPYRLADSIETTTDHGITADGSICIEDTKLDLSKWRNSSDFSVDLMNLRAGLFTELGDVDRGVALRLARFYVSYGFVEEAQLIFDAFGLADQEDAPILMSMIDALSENDAPNSVFQDALTCNSMAGLWGILATRNIPAFTQLDSDAIQLAFNSLPSDMLTYVGPILIDRLVDAKFDDIAHLISLQLQRRQQGKTLETDFAHAQVLAAKGESVTAISKLEELAEDFSNISPEALIDLITLKVAENQAVSPKLALVAEALAWQSRDGELSAQLAQSDALAHLLAVDFSQAIAKFATAPMSDGFANDFVGLAVKNFDDAHFITLTIGHDKFEPQNLSQSTSLAVANRLVNLGFYSHARAFLVNQPLGSSVDDQTTILAKLALVDDDPNRAIDLLTNIETDQAKTLRATAEIARENWSFPIKDTPELADEWKAVSALSASRIEDLPDTSSFLAPLITQTSEPLDAIDDSKILSAANQKSERSAQLRKTVSTILQNLPQ
ncbi:hypothetical protein N9A67_03445 [Rhodobacteraceae bacterium]|nr:hypothetical protein [Paracoccaceae bacterium]